MADYASDQFYNFQSYEGDKRSIERRRKDNPNFIFPGPTTPGVFSPKVDTRYQRGFIRGIYPTELANSANNPIGKMAQRRLFFQFNPATLDRTVQMSELVVNPMLQNPANLFQAVPGSSTFSFELLFNREAEVNSGMFANKNEKLVEAGDLYEKLSEYGGKNTKPGDVATIGVLADMYVLDSIIGQSITPDMVEFLKTYYAYAASSKNESDPVAPTGEEGGGTEASISTFNPGTFETEVSKNYGNAAFLSPLPIRIVFSSLFMVEGFVTRSSVQFVKFTKNYVPTVCKVTLDVQALYFGFAKKKAYLTEIIGEGIKAELDKVQADKQAQQDVVKYLDSIHFEFSNNLMRTETSNNTYGYSDDNSVGDFNHTATTWDEWLTTISQVAGGSNVRFFTDITSYVDSYVRDGVRVGQFSWTLDSVYFSLYQEYTEEVLDSTAPQGVTGREIYRNNYYRSSIVFNTDVSSITNKTTEATKSNPQIKTFQGTNLVLFNSELYENVNKAQPVFLEISVTLTGKFLASTGTEHTATKEYNSKLQIDLTSTSEWTEWVNRDYRFVAEGRPYQA